MSTDQNLESGDNLVEGEQPSSATSKGGSHDSSSANQTQDLIGERIKRIEKMVETMQSNKDKGVNKALNEVEELRKSFSEVQSLMKKGLSEDEAFETLESRKAESEFQRAIVEVRDLLKGGKSLSTQASGAQIEPSVAKVINEYNLDANDPEVIASVLTQTDPKDAEIAAARLMNRRQSQPSASASAASTIVSTPSAPANVDSLTIQYQKEMSAAQGNPSLARALKAEYAKRGVPVDAVVFH